MQVPDFSAFLCPQQTMEYSRYLKKKRIRHWETVRICINPCFLHIRGVVLFFSLTKYAYMAMNMQPALRIVSMNLGTPFISVKLLLLLLLDRPWLSAPGMPPPCPQQHKLFIFEESIIILDRPLLASSSFFHILSHSRAKDCSRICLRRQHRVLPPLAVPFWPCQLLPLGFASTLVTYRSFLWKWTTGSLYHALYAESLLRIEFARATSTRALEFRLMLSFRVSRFFSLAQQRQRSMVVWFQDTKTYQILRILTSLSRLGVNKKVLGYPTPKDLREVTETAAMTSKVILPA